MLAWLKGTIVYKISPNRIILNVNNVGYEIEVPLPLFFELQLKQDCEFYIQTIVREDAFLLYGFLLEEYKHFFCALIKNNGVGPKLAMTVISSMTPEAFYYCIEHKNVDKLCTIPGIGKKTAERLIVDMNGSIPKDKNFVAKDFSTGYGEALQALISLGYKNSEVTAILSKIEDNKNKTCEVLIKDALKLFAVL